MFKATILHNNLYSIVQTVTSYYEIVHPIVYNINNKNELTGQKGNFEVYSTP